MTNRIINTAAFAILAVLWLIFAAALIYNRDLLVTTWQTLRSWNIIIQLIVWLLALPVTLGLWIWQTSWPLLLRLVLISGLAWVTVYMFFPGKKFSQSEPAAKSSPAKP